MKNTRDQFNAIRRSYRLAQKVSPLAHENAVTVYMSTVSALRSFTGKWDCCEPINWARTYEQGRKRGNHWSRSLHVAAACTRFFKGLNHV